ncbi:hypothetical protein D9M71_350700 [compost metagenome]
MHARAVIAAFPANVEQCTAAPGIDPRKPAQQGFPQRGFTDLEQQRLGVLQPFRRRPRRGRRSGLTQQCQPVFAPLGAELFEVFEGQLGPVFARRQHLPGAVAQQRVELGHQLFAEVAVVTEVSALAA